MELMTLGAYADRQTKNVLRLKQKEPWLKERGKEGGDHCRLEGSGLLKHTGHVILAAGHLHALFATPCTPPPLP